MALKRVPVTDPVEKMLTVIEEDGGLIVEGLFPREVIDRMREGVLAAADNFTPGGATQGLGEAGHFPSG